MGNYAVSVVSFIAFNGKIIFPVSIGNHLAVLVIFLPANTIAIKEENGIYNNMVS